MKRLQALLWILVLTACSGQPVPRPKLTAEMYPWRLREPAALGRDFLWQQRLTAKTGQREDTLSVAVQKKGNTLTLIGLTPFNTKAFVLRQQGDDVQFQSFVNREMPFPPRFVLVDVQRAYLALAGDATPAQFGYKSWPLDGEQVEETCANHQLTERKFRRLDGQPPGVVRIRYQGYWPGGAPRRVVIDNGWFGYTLTVETLAETRL